MVVRRSQGEWSRLVAAFEGSNITHEEFCAPRQINVGTFRQALYRTRRAPGLSPTPIAMVSVDVAPTRAPPSDGRPAAGDILITIGDVSVRITASTEVLYVASLVKALRAQC